MNINIQLVSAKMTDEGVALHILSGDDTSHVVLVDRPSAARDIVQALNSYLQHSN